MIISLYGIRDRITPDVIEKLEDNEVYVFASTSDGRHDEGTARIAHENFGAEAGVTDGPTGQCYAIPMLEGSTEEIKYYVYKFIEYASQHPEKRFLVASSETEWVFGKRRCAMLFLKAMAYKNITLPKKWLAVYGVVLSRIRDRRE